MAILFIFGIKKKLFIDKETSTIGGSYDGTEIRHFHRTKPVLPSWPRSDFIMPTDFTVRSCWLISALIKELPYKLSKCTKHWPY